MLSGKKALLVDDNPTILSILKSQLQLAGMTITVLNNGVDVMPTLEKAFDGGEPYDVCLFDMQLRGVDGYEVACQIRNAGNKFADLPLLALSAKMERDAHKCENAGFNGFLSKPIRRDKLFYMLERILGEKKDKGRSVAKAKIKTQYSIREELKHSVRILLVEDNRVNQKLAVMMLTKAGYQVEVAENGHEAIEKFFSAPDAVDLILMDIQMPEMDGLQATKAIRQKGYRDIPIIAMTAHAIKGYQEKCMAAGMNDYIAKPIKREFIFEILDKWVFHRTISSHRKD
jgi:CheY-like chemotaxis protein